MSQPFTFTALGTCGGTISPTLQLQDGTANLGTVTVALTLGQPGTFFSQNFDTVTAPALPSGWTTTNTGVESAWVTRARPPTTPRPMQPLCRTRPPIGTSALVSPAIALPLGQSQLSFRNNYSLEADNKGYYDGGVLEIKIGAGSFTDILTAGGSFVSGGYVGTISALYGNSLSNRLAWSSNSVGFVTTVVNLPAAAAGQTVQLRWLCGRTTATAILPQSTVGALTRLPSMVRRCATNTAPVLPTQPNQTINELTTLTVTNTASGLQSPPAALTYSLVVAPTNATMSTNGVITWTPTQAQSPITNVFTMTVSDNALPALPPTARDRTHGTPRASPRGPTISPVTCTIEQGLPLPPRLGNYDRIDGAGQYGTGRDDRPEQPNGHCRHGGHVHGCRHGLAHANRAVAGEHQQRRLFANIPGTTSTTYFLDGDHLTWGCQYRAV